MIDKLGKEIAFMDTREITGICRALGDANRMAILQLLLEKDMYGAELLEKLNIVQSTLSHHMKVLTDSNIVISHRVQTATVYSINRECIRELQMVLNDRFGAVETIPTEQELQEHNRLIDMVMEVRRKNAAKTEFFNRMSHDLRTSISSMRGFLEIAQRNGEESSFYTDNHKHMEEAVEQMERLLDEIVSNNGSESSEIPKLSSHNQQNTQERESADIRGKRILLAEDNELNAEVTEYLLRDAGAEVVIATDGEQVVESVKESPEGTFDFILMDIVMPKKNGYEATIEIRRLHRRDCQSLPIIAMSANAFDQDIKNALEAGMNAYIAKPLHMDELLQILVDWQE